uniref:Uncharacterized protein n=1 Tax=Candidatus Kentrum sp. MB TaxID=2138164 RepID=A0A450X7N4_9GAMM|nr:MAG: hypothetical protein BECKMB1821G_GA0114241_101246 [Candidatus Kentron sp. MB]
MNFDAWRRGFMPSRFPDVPWALIWVRKCCDNETNKALYLQGGQAIDDLPGFQAHRDHP